MLTSNRFWSCKLVAACAWLSACAGVPSEVPELEGAGTSSTGDAAVGTTDGAEPDGDTEGSDEGMVADSEGSSGTGSTCAEECPPTEWTCETDEYGDGTCQCGCGSPDIDCASDDVSECAYDSCPEGFALEPGQTLDCVEVPPVPADWTCSALRFGDSECDCGCGVIDFDCVSSSPAACASEHCEDAWSLDPEDNAICLPPPADAVDNPSFEETPDGMYDVPGWTVHEDIGGMAYVEISGPGQTSAPEGSRALRLVSTNNDTIGARTVRSSPFLPPAGTCTVTVAVGDSNEGAEFTDFGQVRVRAPSLPNPLDLVAEIDIDNRGMGGVSPPLDGYVDAEVTFTADGETLYHVEIRTQGSHGTLSYHADDVRIACEG